MSASTFDTLDAMRRLEQAGMERAQAEATVDTIREAQSELATKADLRSELAAVEYRLQSAVSELRAGLYRALWIQGAGIVAINSAFIVTAAALGLI